MDDKVNISVRVKPDLKQALEAVAREEGKSVTRVVEWVLKERFQARKKKVEAPA